MVSAVDSSVLFAISKEEPHGREWLQLLIRQRRAGRLIVCEIVVAELAGLLNDESETLLFLADMGIEFDPILPATAVRAGQVFRSYRLAGGPHHNLVPDFLIGAHALLQADQLLAADRGYLRRHFPP